MPSKKKQTTEAAVREIRRGIREGSGMKNSLELRELGIFFADARTIRA
jgi:hypothetical protein